MTDQTDQAPEAAPNIIARIKERLQALGISERAASIEAVGHPSAIRNIRTGATKDPGISTLAKLAPVLDTTPEWLAYGIGVLRESTGPATRRASGYLPVTGEVSAGQWREVDQSIDHPVYEPIPISADARYPANRQYALITRGTSINRMARDGDYLCCLDTQGTNYTPSDNHLVIVERRRDGGGLVERTAKKYRRNGDLHEFHPDSTDPAHRPIVLDPEEPVEHIEVAVVARVLSIYRGLVGEDAGAQT